MNIVSKEQLITFIKKGNDTIKGIQNDQLILVKNFVKKFYGLEIGNVVMLNDTKIKVKDISFTDNGKKLTLHYQRVKFNGSVESMIYTTQIVNNKIQQLNELS